MTPHTTHLASAFVWTCAIMTVALLIAYLPLVRGVVWWVWGGAQP